MTTNKTVEQLEAELQAAYAAARELPEPRVTSNRTVSSPSPSPQDRYVVTSWGESEFDFQVPSGQLCRMKKIKPEELVGAGILNKITRLPGFAQQAIDKAEGTPPKAASADEVPAEEDINALLEVLDDLIPMVVVAPKVHREPAEGEERVAGLIYIRDIELQDRVAIMERAVSGVKKFDNFRQES